MKIYGFKKTWMATHCLCAITTWILYYFTKFYGEKVGRDKIWGHWYIIVHIGYGVGYYLLASVLAFACAVVYLSVESAKVRRWILRGTRAIGLMVCPLFAAHLGVHLHDICALCMFVFGVGSLISAVMIFEMSTDFGVIDTLIGVAVGIVVQLEGRITWKSVLIAAGCMVRYILMNGKKWLHAAPVEANDAGQQEGQQNPV